MQRKKQCDGPYCSNSAVHTAHDVRCPMQHRASNWRCAPFWCILEADDIKLSRGKFEEKCLPEGVDTGYGILGSKAEGSKNFWFSSVSFMSISLVDMMLQNLQYQKGFGGSIQWTKFVVVLGKENFIHRCRSWNYSLIISWGTFGCQCKNILSCWIIWKIISMFQSKAQTFALVLELKRDWLCSSGEIFICCLA